MRDRESGIALVTVVLGMAAVMLMSFLLFTVAQNSFNQAQNQRRDDEVLAATEAMLERYAAKLTIDPSYYVRQVDEAEPPRVCAEGPSTGLVKNPGETWFADCPTWTYNAASDYYYHPLLNPGGGSNVGALIQVSPPIGGSDLEVTVVGRQGEKSLSRAVTANLRPESISEFAFLVERSLYFGRGAKIGGKIYVGGDLGFSQSSPIGEVYANIFAHGEIGPSSSYGPPIFKNGAEGWDSTGSFNDIDEVYPTPLSFDGFWDDLDLIQDSACSGGGICLDRSTNPAIPTGTEAYLIEPFVAGTTTKFRISYSTSTPNSPHSGSCLSTEERWWVNAHNASWTQLGVYDMPTNGAIWADDHVVIGEDSSTPAVIRGAATIYAGTSASRKNIVINTDILYADGLTGTDVLGLISSDEVAFSPQANGTDDHLIVHAAILVQGTDPSVDGSIFSADACGKGGSILTDNYTASGGLPELTMWSSISQRRTGSVSSDYNPRNYNFDPRLQQLRPPFFPLLSDKWEYGNWREGTLPSWADVP